MAYTAKTPLHMSLWDAGGEVEVEAVIDFTVTKFRAATMESPEEPPMAEVSNFRIRKFKTGEWLTCPAWISDAFEGDESFMNWLVSEAAEQDEAARDDAADNAAEAAWERQQQSLMESGGPDDSAYRRQMTEAGRGHLLR